MSCTKNGSYCENEKKKEKKSGGGGSGGMCTKNGSYCEKEKKVEGGGQGRSERRNEAFVKIQKKIFCLGGCKPRIKGIDKCK